VYIEVVKDWCSEKITARVVEDGVRVLSDDGPWQEWQNTAIGTFERAQKKYEAALSAVRNLANYLASTGTVTEEEAGAMVVMWKERWPAPLNAAELYYFDADEGYVRFPDVAVLEYHEIN